MWIVFVVAAAFFVAILGMGYFAVREAEARREAPAGADLAPALQASCAVCEGALPVRPATSDQVVFEVERRIDAELRDIVHALHAHPERLGRIFHA